MIGLAESVSALRFLLDAGVDEAIEDTPTDWSAVAIRARGKAAGASPPPAAPQPAASLPPDRGPGPAAGPAENAQQAKIGNIPPLGANEAGQSARAAAAAAHDLDSLKTALAAFDGCALKKTATNLVFGMGSRQARIMLVGEAPGENEDRQGLPFVGPAGQLLDRMLAAIGLDRHAEDPAKAVYITNMLPWRPPGNRSPTDSEIAACMPFMVRHIELLAPDFLIFAGGISAKAMLNRTEGITRLRGRWFDYGSAGLRKSVTAIPMLHPAYLLRNPAAKREAWKDLLALRLRLDGADAG
ncbi:uracil-DNA glycosylase [Niveispirillum fermenti]|uniref:uracil-DNA glycosylase n=1 Tax=Niveispirillum fermenti TaxID=1233113 RepID=UPI003A875FDF